MLTPNPSWAIMSRLSRVTIQRIAGERAQLEKGRISSAATSALVEGIHG